MSDLVAIITSHHKERWPSLVRDIEVDAFPSHYLAGILIYPQGVDRTLPIYTAEMDGDSLFSNSDVALQFEILRRRYPASLTINHHG